MTEIDQGDFDELGLLANRHDAEVLFGAVNVRPAMTGGTFHEAMSELPQASIRFDAQLARGLLIDYLAPVMAAYGSPPRPRFFGDVLSAVPAGDAIDLDLSSMPELQESMIGALMTSNVPHYEVMHVLTRSAGLTEGQINIEGLDKLPLEVFEIAAPVDGLSIETPATVGTVRLVPFDTVAVALRTLNDDPEMIGPFERAGCVALSTASASRMLDAEAIGLSEIDHALSWLAVGFRYGLSHWPDGQPRQFNRGAFRALPERADRVWLRGVMSGRQMLRSPSNVPTRPELDLSLLHLDVEPPSGLSVQDRQAIEALRRAAGATDPIQAITALWDAIEFYVAGTTGHKTFSELELKDLRKAVPKSLAAPLRARAIESIGRLNQLPLLSRLRAAVDEDAVPTDDDEWAMLQRLRRSRNALVHGAGAESISPPREILRAIAFVARLLVYRAHRIGAQ